MVDWCNHLHEKQQTETASRRHLLFLTHARVNRLLKGAVQSYWRVSERETNTGEGTGSAMQ